MRRTLALVSSVVLLVAIPAGVLAVTIRNGSRLDHQRSAVRSNTASTSSTSWTDVPGLRGLDVCAAGSVSAAVSVDVSGAPVDLRVQWDDVPLALRPRVAHFDPSGGTTSFSFTFVGHMQSFEGSDGHLFDVQWRSPTGAPVTLNRGNVNLLFGRGSC
jgi:hypothetical protein